MIMKKLFLGAAALSSLAACTTTASRQSAAFDFEPNPAIWKMADEDTTIYIFGTIHMLPKRLKWRTAAFNRIVKDVDTLVVETAETDEEAVAGLEQMLDEMLERSTEQKPLMDRIKPENRETLKQLVEETGLPLGMFDVLPGWMVPFMVYFQSLEETELEGEYGVQFGVETVLENEFQKAQKQILSIEDGNAVIAALSALPEDEQIGMVDQMLEEIRTVGSIDKIADVEPKGDPTVDFAEDISWAKGQIATLESGLTEAELGKGMYRVLIIDRNRAWTDWLIERLDRPGKILVAVGAGHLAGKDSLQSMLTARGKTVERIQ